MVGKLTDQRRDLRQALQARSWLMSKVVLVISKELLDSENAALGIERIAPNGTCGE